MSASLVGSEMCIRDRTTPQARLAPRPGGACREAVRITWSAACAEARAKAVSYTHLTLPTICSV
eukprot:12007897-Alexandrium_andersonii.AAC.1